MCQSILVLFFLSCYHSFLFVLDNCPFEKGVCALPCFIPSKRFFPFEPFHVFFGERVATADIVQWNLNLYEEFLESGPMQASTICSLATQGYVCRSKRRPLWVG